MVSDSCNSNLLQKASKNVERFYGSVKSKPIIACISNPKLGLKISHGRTNFSFGLPSIILLGPKGMEENVSSHEWMHAELESRVGFLKRQLFIPTWFDEGLAMQVDHRIDYNQLALKKYVLKENLKIPNLNEIINSNFFVNGNKGKLNYALSRCIINKWLSENPKWLIKLKTVSFNNPLPIKEFNSSCF